MSLYCDVRGSGPDVVLLHGWGWHGDLWREVADNLARDFRVWVPDLPGHARSQSEQKNSLAEWCEAIEEVVPRAAAWVGWSLGAQLSLNAACRGVASRVALVSATPCFVQHNDWAHAVSPQWLERFSIDVEIDPVRALERFASLHLAGAGNERPLLRQLRNELARHPASDATALVQGLRLLETMDLRSQVPTIHVPVLVIHGEHDQVTPFAAGEWLAQHLSGTRRFIKMDAGHAPFLSHSSVFIEMVRDFLHD